MNQEELAVVLRLKDYLTAEIRKAGKATEDFGRKGTSEFGKFGTSILSLRRIFGSFMAVFTARYAISVFGQMAMEASDVKKSVMELKSAFHETIASIAQDSARSWIEVLKPSLLGWVGMLKMLRGETAAQAYAELTSTQAADRGAMKRKKNISELYSDLKQIASAFSGLAKESLELGENDADRQAILRKSMELTGKSAASAIGELKALGINAEEVYERLKGESMRKALSGNMLVMRKETGELLNNLRQLVRKYVELESQISEVGIGEGELRTVMNTAMDEHIAKIKTAIEALDGLGLNGQKIYDQLAKAAYKAGDAQQLMIYKWTEFEAKGVWACDQIYAATQRLQEVVYEVVQIFGTQLFAYMDDLVEGTVKPLRDYLKDIVKDLARMAGQMALNIAAQAISAAAGGGAYAALAAKGGVFPESRARIPIRAYQAGGITKGPELAVYGEGSRREAVVPLPDNRSIPVKILGGQGGGLTVNIAGPADGEAVRRMLYKEFPFFVSLLRRAASENPRMAQG